MARGSKSKPKSNDSGANMAGKRSGGAPLTKGRPVKGKCP